MTKSESIIAVCGALSKAQAEMPVVAFDAQNKFLNNKYASLGAVIQASRPILAKYKLSLVQFPISGACDRTNGTDGTDANGAHGVTRPTVDYIGVESVLTHESGEFIAERILVPITEEKGKSRVQVAGSILTYLRRYSWASILGMYADQDTDGASPIQAFTQKPAAALPPPPQRKQQKQN